MNFLVASIAVAGIYLSFSWGEEGSIRWFLIKYVQARDGIRTYSHLDRSMGISMCRTLGGVGVPKTRSTSTGGTLTMLAALTYPHFRAAASFSGSPAAVGYTRHAVAIGDWSDIPFDYRNAEELQLRSARVYGQLQMSRTTLLWHGREALCALPSAYSGVGKATRAGRSGHRCCRGP
jgi:hypothetical protein